VKKQFFILSCALSIACNTTAFDQRYFFDTTDSWTYLEKIFITDIYNAKNAFWSKTTSIIPLVSAVISATQYYNHQQDFKNELTPKNKFVIKNLMTAENLYFTGMIVSAGIVAQQFATSYAHSQVNRQAVDDFFSNWEINSLYTPDEFQDAFFMIAEIMEFQGKEAILEHADEIVETIQFLIIRHFESRYKKLLEIESCNALGDFKASTEIFKNIIGTAKDLAA